MRAVIVGGGSVGLLLAARLQLGGGDVHLLTRSEEQAESIRASQLTLQQLDGRTVTVPISVSSCQPQWPLAEVYVIAVKQTHMESLLPKLRQIQVSARVIALQNGMGHKELLEQAVSSDQLFFGVNTEGARRVAPNQVVHTGKGTIRIGPWTPRTDQDEVIQQFANDAKLADIPALYVEETSSLLWRKLAANAVINPLTAITGMTNGELLQYPDMLDMMGTLFAEVRQVAEASGHNLNQDDWQDILNICRNTSRNYSSMLQDLFNNKKTEIDSINGYIVEKAREHKLLAPMNETLYRAVLLKSSLRQSKGEAFDANTE